MENKRWVVREVGGKHQDFAIFEKANEMFQKFSFADTTVDLTQPRQRTLSWLAEIELNERVDDLEENLKVRFIVLSKKS